MTPLLEAQDLVFSYGGTPAVRGLSLDLRPGTLLGLLGPNGCGKSTLLRLLSGALRPREGAVLLGGRPLATWPHRERAKAMAVVPQSTDLAFPFTVAELVRMGRTPHLGRFAFESAEDHKVADAAMEALDLGALHDRPATSCSGGERQRALIARAVAQATPVLLLDEPTSSLDLHHRVAVFALLVRHCRAGGSALVVSHDPNLAAQACDRLVVMRAGRIDAEGTVEDVMRQEVLERAYGASVAVGRHESGRPWALPLLTDEELRGGREAGAGVPHIVKGELRR
ncbi:MAG: hemin import ATP-binding protein HmuV [Myxococcales bacterium]